MPSLKLVLLGDSSVGKSSLVNRFAMDSFNPHSPNTIGAAFISKVHGSNDRKVKFEVWDTAGQERYKSLTPMYYRNAKVALLCFDLSNVEQSFERAQYWNEQLAVSGPADIDIIVVGTKMDLVNADMADSGDSELARVEKYCSEKNLRFVKTSAKSGEGVASLFDSIVDSLDEEFFQQQDQETLESGQGQEHLVLGSRARSSRCC